VKIRIVISWFVALIFAMIFSACAKSTNDTFTVGTEYPVQTRGYICTDEASLLKAKNDFDSSAQFIAQPNCAQISFGDTLTVTAANDPYLTVQVSSGMNRGVSTTGYSGLTFPDYLSK
jgi:hypothetical protein